MNIKIGKVKTVLLLHMNGTNGSQSFVDSSRNNCSISAFDNAQISTAQSKFGGASAVFDDIDGYLEIANRPDFGFGTGDFTVECWVYFSEVPSEGKTIISLQSPESFSFYYDGGTYQNNYLVISNRLSNQISYGWTPTINTWYHLAVSRSGGFLRLFINGNMVSQVADSTNYNSGDINIGGDSVDGGTWTLDGYIDELRIIKGAGVYTSNFTPPTSEFPNEDSSLSITKGGTAKLNQKKYIDLLPPTFISKVTLSGGDYSNGVYTRNSGGTTTFNGPDGKYIEWQAPYWVVYEPLIDDFAYSSVDLINWFETNLDNPPIGLAENSLTFLFDPIFYKSEIQNERYQIKLEGCSLPYVNGIYSQTVNPSLINNRPYFLKDDDQSVEIVFEDGTWYIYDLFERDYYALFTKNDECNNSLCRPDYLNWTSPDGGDAYNNGETPPTITQYLNLMFRSGGDLDPAYLEKLRSYQQDNIIPNLTSALTKQQIFGSSFNSRKVELANNALKYVKNNDNSDVPYLKEYGKIMLNASQINELKFPLLICAKNNNSTIFDSKNTYTLNMFVKLQRPVSHKSPTNYIVREKRGIFLTSNYDRHSPFVVGYRSPYYNIDGDNTYKYKFEPFSFVFSFGHNFTGGSNFTLMTDYKYKFGEMYMLTAQNDGGVIRIYVNGELQSTASLPFNPCLFPLGENSRSRRQHQARINIAPLAPGFLRKNGAQYSVINTQHNIHTNGSNPINYLCFGKSLIANASLIRWYTLLEEKRYLNNIEIGVINAYNIALSQTQIFEIYNNFRYRYI